MKTFLSIAFALMLFGAKAQSLSGTIVQCREMKTTLPELGVQKLLFCEATVNGKVELLLLSDQSNAKPGQTFTLHEAHDVPKYIVLDGKKYYCYLSKYLQKAKS